MRYAPKPATACILSLILAGCAIENKHDTFVVRYVPQGNPPGTSAYVSHAGYSAAMNVLLGSGLVYAPDPAETHRKTPNNAPVVEDSPSGDGYHPERVGAEIKRFCRNLPSVEDSPVSFALSLSDIGLHASHFLPPPTGIGYGANLAILGTWLVTSLLSQPSGNTMCFATNVHPLTLPLLITWERRVGNAVRDWNQALREALEEVMPGRVQWVDGITASGKRVEAPQKFALLDETCEDEMCTPTCVYTASSWIYMNYTPKDLILIFHRWPVRRSPDFAGQFGPAASVVTSQPKDLMVSWSKPGCPQDIPYLRLFEAISAHLPEEYFLYLPPGIPAGPGRQPNAKPVVLHQGRTLEFRAPFATPLQ